MIINLLCMNIQVKIHPRQRSIIMVWPVRLYCGTMHASGAIDIVISIFDDVAGLGERLATTGGQLSVGASVARAIKFAKL